MTVVVNVDVNVSFMATTQGNADHVLREVEKAIVVVLGQQVAIQSIERTKCSTTHREDR